MKAPDINPIHGIGTSPTDGTRKGKILLFTPDLEDGRLLIAELKKTDPFIVETVDNFDDLIHEIARTTPHFVVIHVPIDSDEGAWMPCIVQRYFPDLPVWLIPGKLSDNLWQSALQAVLTMPIEPEVPRPYAADKREVMHDESLRVFGKGKLNRPKREEGWEKLCAQQEARFVLQLQNAKKNHAAAKHYYQCLLHQQAGLDQEIGYRLAHGSYKALSWSRDLACKWLALLAHYISDVELEYLPKANSPSCHVDFVHHHTPIEALYAASLIILSQVKPSIAVAIKELLIAQFDGQDEDALLALSFRLFGMAKWLEQVGRAQIELMDLWLHPSILDRAAGDDVPRGEHRNAGIYRDFYDLTFIVNSPEPLASILRGFHTGTTYVPQDRFMPSFAEFRRLGRGEATFDHQPKT